MAKVGAEVTKAVLDICKKGGLTPKEAINAALLTAGEIAFTHSEPLGTMAHAFGIVKLELDNMHKFAIEFGDPRLDKPEAN